MDSQISLIATEHLTIEYFSQKTDEDLKKRTEKMLCDCLSPGFLSDHDPCDEASGRSYREGSDFPDGVVDSVLRIVIGSSRDRLGKRPSSGNMALLHERVMRFVRECRPVEIRLVWVPKKRGVPAEDSQVDLGELLCINRLVELSRKVESIYPPGLHYNVFLIDFEGLYIEGDSPDVRRAMDSYIEGMRAIIATGDLERKIRLVRVSESAPESEKAKWREQLQENFHLLKRYWIESETKGIEGFETYRSYRDLRAVKWKGCLPPESRTYFLERMNGLCPDGSVEEKLDIVLRNFSASLLHHQFMILRTPGMAPLNLSFTPPAPRVPQHLMKARIDLRSISPEITRTSVPPWAARGFILSKDGKVRPAMKGWRETLQWVHLMVKGGFWIKNGWRSALVRADCLSSAL